MQITGVGAGFVSTECVDGGLRPLFARLRLIVVAALVAVMREGGTGFTVMAADAVSFKCVSGSPFLALVLVTPTPTIAVTTAIAPGASLTADIGVGLAAHAKLLLEIPLESHVLFLLCLLAPRTRTRTRTCACAYATSGVCALNRPIALCLLLFVLLVLQFKGFEGGRHHKLLARGACGWAQEKRGMHVCVCVRV